ncbi:MAG: hypothetical protein IJZ35_06465 [Clostridia bacterium]|nr:hypothetical protein [Clostridia bacterium]
MTDKNLEALFSELTQEELQKITESPINLDCELDDAAYKRICARVQSATGRESEYIREVKSMKKSRKFKIALIAAVLALVMAVSAGAVYQFVLSDGLKDSLNLETVERIKTIVDTDAVNENTVQTMQKTVSTYGHTITFEAIVEGTAIQKSLEFILSNEETGEVIEVDRNYAIFSIRRDDGGPVLNNKEYPRDLEEFGYNVLIHGYDVNSAMFTTNCAGFYEEGNVLYYLCDITDAYIFADYELSIVVCGERVIDGTVVRLDENGDHYLLETYDDIKALFDFDLDDEYADTAAQLAAMEERPYCFVTDPDYSEFDKIIEIEEDFKNSSIDLSYAIGNRRWKGSYPLQFGEVEHSKDFVELYKNRASLDTVSFETYAECVNEAWEAQDAMAIDFIVEKTGKALEDITDDEFNALGDEFEAYKDEYCIFTKSYVDEKISFEKFSDGSEYAYLGENQFLYFPVGTENAKLIIVASEKAVISLDVSIGDMYNLYDNVNPDSGSYPGYILNIWYLEGGANENSVYAYAYNEDDYNAYSANPIISPTEATYRIAMEFAYYNGIIQVFAE